LNGKDDFCENEYNFYALDTDGNLKWKTNNLARIIIGVENGIIYCEDIEGELLNLSQKDGQLMWNINLGGIEIYFYEILKDGSIIAKSESGEYYYHIDCKTGRVFDKNKDYTKLNTDSTDFKENKLCWYYVNNLEEESKFDYSYNYEEKMLYVYDKNGQVLWEYKFNKEFYRENIIETHEGICAIMGDTFFFFTYEGSLLRIIEPLRYKDNIESWTHLRYIPVNEYECEQKEIQILLRKDSENNIFKVNPEKLTLKLGESKEIIMDSVLAVKDKYMLKYSDYIKKSQYNNEKILYGKLVDINKDNYKDLFMIISKNSKKFINIISYDKEKNAAVSVFLEPLKVSDEVHIYMNPINDNEGFDFIIKDYNQIHFDIDAILLQESNYNIYTYEDNSFNKEICSNYICSVGEYYEDEYGYGWTRKYSDEKYVGSEKFNNIDAFLNKESIELYRCDNILDGSKITCNDKFKKLDSLYNFMKIKSLNSIQLKNDNPSICSTSIKDKKITIKALKQGTASLTITVKNNYYEECVYKLKIEVAN
jgi:hypothetical protein